MRKNKLTILLIFVVIACLTATFVACNKDGENVDNYTPGTTTIVAPDDGIAKIDYQVTVLYPDLTPVFGVEVQLFLVDDDELPYCGATTDSNGVATLNTSKGLEYFVRVKGLPEGYIYEDDALIADDETTQRVIIELEGSENKYDITVKTEGGMTMKGVTVSLKDGDSIIASKVTDADGFAGVKVGSLGEYTIELSGLPVGYSVKNAGQKTSASAGAITVTTVSSVVKETIPTNKRYKMDDIMYDFSVTTSDGSTFTLSEVLEEKDFVMINFWATWCGPCKTEFEYIQKAYERYQDNMAIIAISIDDTNQDVITFKSEYTPALTFDMSTDQNSLYGRFAAYSTGVPLTIFVDRYGKICNYVMGGGTEALFKQEFARYTDPDYVQVAYDPANDEIPIEEGDAPDVELPESDEIVNKISPSVGGTYTDVGDGKIWPWILGKDGDDDILYAANITHNNTQSIVYYTFKLNAGEFLTFDYKMNTEDIGNADIMSVYIDGSWMCDLERISDGWQTMYLYSPINADDAQSDHLLTLHYVKDASDGLYLDGDEIVAIKNVRKVNKADLVGDVNILREASWDYSDETGRYTKYVDVVFNTEDGYYHVGSADGPYLLANLGGSTHYNNMSITEMVASGYFELAGLQAQLGFISDGLMNGPEDSYVEYHKGYTWFAGNSDLPNYCYVDGQLKRSLDIIAKKFYDAKIDGEHLSNYYDANTWLEFCAYVDNCAGEPMGNIMKGISYKEALDAVGNNQPNHVVIDKTLVPRGISYKYVPTETGAYKVYSKIDKSLKQGGFVYITDSKAKQLKSDDASEDFEVYVTFEAGETYYINVAFDLPSSWGEYDFYIQYVGASYDHFTSVTDGTYTYVVDEKGDAVLDNGNYIYVVNKYDSDLEVGIGEDGYYHQKVNGEIDTGDNSYIWIAIAQGNVLLNATIEQLAKGTVRIDGSEVDFFDFTSEGGEDCSDYIIKLAEESLKQDPESDTYGMVKADAKLVDIIKRALDRTDHDSDESWLGIAFYYEHLGEYPAKAE